MTSINRNNITLKELGHGGGSSQDCCIVIGPKQCIPTQVSPYTRCFHTRSRQCGSYCSASIVHQETRQICNSMDSYGRATNCQQQVAYVPQPQPRCVYTSSWPYVSCGIQPPSNCEGCYGHFVNPQIKQYKPCSPQCYDSFNVGPLYRQGPFYQPPTNCGYSPQGCFTGFGGGVWPGLGSFGAGAAQFAQGFGAGNVGFNAFQPTGLPVQPYMDGFPDMWNFTAFNSSAAATLEAAQPQVVEEPQNDMPFVYRLWEAYKDRQENDTDISVVNT